MMPKAKTAKKATIPSNAEEAGGQSKAKCLAFTRQPWRPQHHHHPRDKRNDSLIEWVYGGFWLAWCGMTFE